MKSRLLILLVVVATVLAACAPAAAPTPTPPPEAKKFTVIHVPKLVGIDYFKSCYQGMEEAAKELGNIELEEVGPLEADAAKQAELIDGLIGRKPDALLVSANDPDALVPVLKRAMEA
ncbi:MAG TPA: rhamnose ABC transporter substrate-binding protein, partial [Anaerolineae bacterium]|nr:rhamnose ABC transporter substrate-binding protein [Anaerolineae bacterium]